MASEKKNSISVRGPKRKHNTISIQDKIEVLEKLDCGISIRQLCEAYGIGKTTVVDIEKQREKLLAFYTNCDSKKHMSTRKTMKDSKSAEHDGIMIAWFKQQRNEGIELSGRMVKSQAKIFHKELKLPHKCDYSDGWLNRFKKRHGISLQKGGEKWLAHPQEGCNEFAQEFPKYATNNNLSLEMYNTNESAMYWQSQVRNPPQREAEEEASAGFTQMDNKDNLSADWGKVYNETEMISHGGSEAANMDNRVNEIKNDGSVNENGTRSARTNIDRLIALTTELIAGLGQHTFVTEQELTNLCLMQEKLQREKSKYLIKQLHFIDQATKKTNSGLNGNHIPSNHYEDAAIDRKPFHHTMLKNDFNVHYT